MVRRSQQRRRDEKLAARSAAPERSDQGTYIPPDRAKCEQTDMPHYGPAHERVRPRIIVWRQAGRLVEFVVRVDGRRGDGTWKSLLEIDCKHGHVHYHEGVGTDRSEGTHLHRLDTVADVQVGLKVTLNFANGYIAEKIERGD